MLVNTAGASAAALVLVRGLSPLWMVSIFAVTFVLTPIERWRRWSSSTLVRLWSLIVVVSTVLASAWIVGARALDTQPWTVNRYRKDGLLGAVGAVFDRTGLFMRQMEAAVTDDAHVPTADYIVVFTLLGLLIVGGLIAGRNRERVALGSAAIGMVLFPIVLAAPRIQSYGITWQGRYGLPFVTGVPLLAGAALFDSSRLGAVRGEPTARYHFAIPLRMAATAVVGLAWLEVGIAFWCELRRYTVGTLGPLNLLDDWHPPWSPALPLPILAAAVLTVLAALMVWCFGLLARSRRPRVHR
jgi:hypothetical protein